MFKNEQIERKKNRSIDQVLGFHGQHWSIESKLHFMAIAVISLEIKIF